MFSIISLTKVTVRTLITLTFMLTFMLTLENFLLRLLTYL